MILITINKYQNKVGLKLLNQNQRVPNLKKRVYKKQNKMYCGRTQMETLLDRWGNELR